MAEGRQAVNALGVSLLAQGRLSEAIDVLEDVLRASPASVAAAEPFLFNLCAFDLVLCAGGGG